MAGMSLMLLVFRLILAGLLVVLAVPGLLGGAERADVAGLTPLLRGLLATVAVWLVFGIRTRVAASVGVVLAFALVFLALPLDPHGPAPLVAILVLGFALPPVCCGGGDFALHRGGWARLF
ncbi:hypothetical protein [Rubellimicrobium sp. CFH 75288]|uniref:hypothetical protein n=1 Tax=Rubellimicrobium sp. CFH 75288 TaxID=2697034 RepID=UPI001412A57F|nr:hypothetical protein [Rubellimicrobium sp. CFH 75288]NAZ36952.1 hypothetical protein [Rubellimicrobium sp. CFH 75288]